MSSVEATSPPTSTWAPLPNSTPLGLTRNTWPLAVSRPWMSDAPAEVSTRLSATDPELGWTKLTAALAPILKVDQLRIARSLD